MDLGEDLIESWSAGSTDEYWNQATSTWEWNNTEAGGGATRSDHKMGLSALAAAVYRFKRPRTRALRRRYRDYAIQSVDAWFRDYQDPVTGGIFWDDVAAVADQSGQATFMGLSNVAIVVACLELPNRWRAQILRALDYTTGRGELTYYTNGNFMLYKLVSYDLGAYVSGNNATRVGHVDDLWEFTYDPTGFVGNPLQWRGCGYFEDAPGVGYFSEVTDTNSSVDHSAEDTFDAVYAHAQSNFAAVGYLLFGDDRYADAAFSCMRSMLPISSETTNQFTYVDGSRHPGSVTRNVDTPTVPLAAWVLDDAEIAARLENFLYHPSNSLDADYRQYLNTTHATFVRHFGLSVAASIIAAHGRPL